jgi:quercetin dioxygenase-like cupin family protein
VTLEHFDYRTDLRNVFITPELRCRFMKIPAGTTTGSHTHDLGHEVFMVMEGQIEFDVAGRKAVLGPGQMCVARVDEPHTLRTLGDEDATIYLSVTPHIQPTHTSWDAAGQKRPPRYDSVQDGWEHTPAAPELVDRQLAAVRALAEAAQAALAAHERTADELKRAIAAGDPAAARPSVDAMWAGISQTFQRASAMADVWNELAPRATRQQK